MPSTEQALASSTSTACSMTARANHASVAATFLIRDGSALDVFVYCKIGNYQKFRVNFGHTSSSVSAELNANTRSTAYFNDDVNTHVRTAGGRRCSEARPTVGVDHTRPSTLRRSPPGIPSRARLLGWTL